LTPLLGVLATALQEMGLKVWMWLRPIRPAGAV